MPNVQCSGTAKSHLLVVTFEKTKAFCNISCAFHSARSLFFLGCGKIFIFTLCLILNGWKKCNECRDGHMGETPANIQEDHYSLQGAMHGLIVKAVICLRTCIEQFEEFGIRFIMTEHLFNIAQYMAMYHLHFKSCFKWQNTVFHHQDLNLMSLLYTEIH